MPDRNPGCHYSLVVERQPCKLKVLGSIPSGGFTFTGARAHTNSFGLHHKVRRPGIEPGPSAWKADILTTRPTTLAVLDIRFQVCLSENCIYKAQNTPGRTRTCNLWIRSPTRYPLRHKGPRVFSQNPSVVLFQKLKQC